jgi:hypothetical protein
MAKLRDGKRNRPKKYTQDQIHWMAAGTSGGDEDVSGVLGLKNGTLFGPLIREGSAGPKPPPHTLAG